VGIYKEEEGLGWGGRLLVDEKLFKETSRIGRIKLN
jgi:hypothetical protein